MLHRGLGQNGLLMGGMGEKRVFSTAGKKIEVSDLLMQSDDEGDKDDGDDGDSMAAKLRAAYQLIKQVQRGQITYLCDNSVPIDVQGTMELPLIPERYYVVNFMEEKKITDELIKEHLFGLIQRFFKAIEEKDEETIRSLTEHNFSEKLIKAKESSTGFKFQGKEIDLDKVQIIDKILVRGVSTVRSENDTNMDYVRVSYDEKKGLRQYIHKFQLGLQDYYF